MDAVEIYNKMQPILEHNYQMLVNQTFSQDITQV
jgi:hypothetical protein